MWITLTFNGVDIRAFKGLGTLWYASRDVFRALGYRQKYSGPILHKVPPEHKMFLLADTRGGTQSVLCLSKQGVLVVTSLSKKPSAASLCQWLT